MYISSSGIPLSAQEWSLYNLLSFAKISSHTAGVGPTVAGRENATGSVVSGWLNGGQCKRIRIYFIVIKFRSNSEAF